MFALTLLGCSQAPSLMPMEVGRSTTYVVTYGLERHPEPVTVSREVPVSGASGYELTGEMGASRLVWKDGVLLASQTANAWFDPPIPLVAADAGDRSWSGRVASLGTKSLASATLTHSKEKLDLAGKTLDTVLSVLTIQLPRGRIEVSSWFQPGVGLVQQEQRTGDNLVVKMEMIGGPKDP
jgi:hypothetical protein